MGRTEWGLHYRIVLMWEENLELESRPGLCFIIFDRCDQRKYVALSAVSLNFLVFKAKIIIPLVLSSQDF